MGSGIVHAVGLELELADIEAVSSGIALAVGLERAVADIEAVAAPSMTVVDF